MKKTLFNSMLASFKLEGITFSPRKIEELWKRINRKT